MSDVSDSRVRLLKTVFVVYYHADFAQGKQFLLDFGLTGTEPYVYIARQGESVNAFGGAAYVVESRELEKAHTQFGATALHSINGPGAGEQATLTDPLGNPTHLIWGWQEMKAQSLNLERLTVNYEYQKPRKGRFQRFKPGPAPAHRWGHYGVTYTEGTYESKYNWYTTTLTLAHSEFPANPHQPTNVAHTSFEVHHYDIQHLGHDYLTPNGYKICWRVGRHDLNSQVFDYWFDPSEIMLEHYADGDLVNIETPIAHVPAGPQALSVWGPPVPPVF
ncbi:hypothetical protein BDV29DRAFT_193194 [Aspergillus leporis]|uniref:Glyoxalase/Bleomycin resistance protein/Dihydroxybiphenyl dioxygenase n=1 Tax=Aspergillus leporis TaxID=41062 RepID=A0A5N5WSW5_9EURO|nr:hypothetical protein BDV29DRAFT_193194 [Aspergillus leporis]